MRASVLLVVILGLFAASEALDLKDVGASLVNKLFDSIKTKAAEIGQKLLSNLLEKFGKREETMSLLDHAKSIAAKLKDLLAAGKGLASTVFGKAIDRLRELAKKFHASLGVNSDAKAVSDKVDDVVADHHVQQKRLLSELLQKGKDLLSSAVETVKGLFSGLKAKASEIFSGLLQKGTDVLVGKRATLSEHLQNIGKAISSAVSPFKDIVAGLGNTLKGHFSNLVNTVKGHVSALKDKLAGHVEDLKTHGKTLLEHGKNALGALGEVVGDILKQTLTNSGPALDGLAKTLSSAGSTVLKHFTGADKATSTF